MVGLFVVAIVAMWLDTRQTFVAFDAEHVWTAAIYGAAPLCAALAWDLRESAKSWLPRVGLLLVVGVVAARVLSSTVATELTTNPWPLLGVCGLATGLALVAAPRQALEEWGLGLGDTAWWLPRVGVAIVGMVVICVVAAAVDPAFVAEYPQWPPARESLPMLLRYQLSLGVYMLGWELFYRGLFLRGLARRIDPLSAVLVAGVPFFLLHWHKPELEMLSSYVGSVGLGWFCLRARTFWPAFLLHCGINATMELTCFALRSGAQP